MSHKGGKWSQMESVRLKINGHMTSVGEEILCVLDKQQRGVDVYSVTLNVRVFVLERLSAVGEFICSLIQREIETLETQLLETQNKLLDIYPNTAAEHEENKSPSLAQEEPQRRQEEEAGVSTLLHRKTSCDTLTDVLQLHVCKVEVPTEEERSPSLVKEEEPEPPLIKEEQKELLQRPEEVDRPMLTLLAVKSEHDAGENRETEPVASTSTEHTQAYIKYWVRSQATSDDQLLSSHCSEDSGENETHSMESHTEKKSYSCTICEKTCTLKGNLKKHMMTHTDERPFICSVCSKGFNQKGALNIHMRTHTGEKPFTCAFCGKGFVHTGDLKKHMMTHTGEKPFTCTICSKGFSQNVSLKAHTRTHTGGKNL